MEVEQRRQTVVANILAGATYREIAAGLGVSPATIVDDVKEIRAQWRDNYADDADKWINIQLRRYDVMINAIWDKARKGDKESLPFMDRVITLVREQIRLMGIEPAQKHDFDATGKLGEYLIEQMSDAQLIRIANQTKK